MKRKCEFVLNKKLLLKPLLAALWQFLRACTCLHLFTEEYNQCKFLTFLMIFAVADSSSELSSSAIGADFLTLSKMNIYISSEKHFKYF